MMVSHTEIARKGPSSQVCFGLGNTPALSASPPQPRRYSSLPTPDHQVAARHKTTGAFAGSRRSGEAWRCRGSAAWSRRGAPRRRARRRRAEGGPRLLSRGSVVAALWRACHSLRRHPCGDTKSVNVRCDCPEPVLANGWLSSETWQEGSVSHHFSEPSPSIASLAVRSPAETAVRCFESPFCSRR